jgi:hypothetical protein
MKKRFFAAYPEGDIHEVKSLKALVVLVLTMGSVGLGWPKYLAIVEENEQGEFTKITALDQDKQPVTVTAEEIREGLAISAEFKAQGQHITPMTSALVN